MMMMMMMMMIMFILVVHYLLLFDLFSLFLCIFFASTRFPPSCVSHYVIISFSPSKQCQHSLSLVKERPCSSMEGRWSATSLSGRISTSRERSSRSRRSSSIHHHHPIVAALIVVARIVANKGLIMDDGSTW
jgi:hypothetical protein